VCSHLADADGQDEKFTHLQIKEWEKTVAIFQKNFTGLKFYHLAATAGTRHAKKFSSNVVRLGLGLYGINSLPSRELDLRPVLEMRSQISSVKEIKAGEFVGYNCTYKAKEKILGATVPVGYFEGVDRRLSNHGYFKMGAQFCPIIGRVSMNITSLDVSAIPKVKRGDPVSIISQHNQDLNSVENIAKIAHTIPYEILVHIPGHLKRTVVS
jgi:alanine racemase